MAGFQEEVEFKVLCRLHQAPRSVQRALVKGLGVGETGCDEQGKCIVAVDSRYFRPAEVEMLSEMQVKRSGNSPGCRARHLRARHGHGV